MTKYNAFNSKQEYLKARSLWRSDYAKLSTTIRECRNTIKALQRKRAYAGGLQCDLIRFRRDATEMLEARKKQKQLAQRQFQRVPALVG